MPKKIFISYANEAMAYSLKRIGRQARRLGIFDEVLLFTPADLPGYVRESPLIGYPRGAGYWVWKPALIHEVLNANGEGTVVVYVDAGCTLRKSPDWEKYFALMQEYDTVCFQYGDEFPEWEKWGSSSSKLRYWTKKETLDYFEQCFQSRDFYDYNQVWGGCLFIKGKDNSLMDKWFELTFSKPELVMDPSAAEEQYPGFAGHRHDQCIITPLAMTDPTVKILPEQSERYRKDSFVWASRVRARNWREYIVIQVKHYLRIWLGDGRFESIKKKISK